MCKEDNRDMEINVDEEEMYQIDNCKVKKIIMNQFSVNIFRDLDILNLIFEKRQMNKQIQLKLSKSICFYQA